MKPSFFVFEGKNNLYCTKQEKKNMENQFIKRIKEIMIALDCSVIVALEVIKAEKELQQ